MNRYQKPEIYEKLAMEYSLGTLQGHARKRFEQLMEQHPYMAAIVASNDRNFANLVELLPEVKPDPAVWKKISAQINKESTLNTNASPSTLYHSDKKIGVLGSLWQVLINKGLIAAMLLLVLSSVFLLNLGNIPDANAFSATLMSASTNKAMVDVQVSKSDMNLTIKLMEPVQVPDGMKAVFWCIANDKSKPMMNMGTVAAQGMTEMKIQKATWRGIADASKFAVSLEPVDAVNNSSPSGNLIFIGKIKALTKT